MTILQQPDSLSLSGNIKEFRIGTSNTVSFVLSQEGEEIVSRSYEPGADGIVIINIRDIVHTRLSFTFKNTSLVYEQALLASNFKAVISDREVNFRVIRAGVDMFADSAANFLTQNFLTWQPNLKPVTYYSPEFLTYYAVLDSTAMLRAYFTDKTGDVVSQRDMGLADLMKGYAYTIPLQYAAVAEKLGNKMPAYYDVWIENQKGERITYIQRYYASDMKSETEQWILFENSLGGIDTFRAYGSSNFTGEHTHNIAEIDDISLEYRVDTARKFQKDTGYLNKKERSWLLDFFPSLKKYIYTGSYIRSIIVVESNVTYTDKELPSNYSFTYKYADAKPLLNLPRTDVPADTLGIVVPEVGSFTVPPRLVEFPRLPLSEGALFPIQEPYSETWSSTTAGSISDYIVNRISENYGGGGGIGHYHDNIDLLNLLTYAAGYLLIAGKRAKVGYSDEALSFVNDIAKNLVKFQKGLQTNDITTSNYSPGLLGSGGCFKVDPETGKTVLEVDSANLREELVVPKITFNCIDVISGDKANTFSFGIIKNVDTEKCTAELELLEDELGTPQVGDIIRGIFHNIEGANVKEDFYDENGFLNYAGFSTAYFTPLDILADVPGWFKFRYALKAGTTVHPMADMRFYAYGNFYDKTRQSITYENRYYTRRLKNVNTWVINPSKNIAMQDGLLEGLNIGGMVMHGHGTFMENCYFTGVQIQFTPDQKEEIKGEDAYSVSLSTYESLVVLDDESNLIGGLIEERYVVSGDDYVISDDDYVTATLSRLKTRIQAFKGSRELYYSDEYHEDAYMVILNAIGCKAVVDNGLVAITEINDYENCYVDIAVNCEGNCVFDKFYKITAVRNGTSVIYGDIDNEMASVSCDTAGNVLLGLPVSTNVNMWYGNKELSVDKVELALPDGVEGITDKGNISITGISQESLNSLNIGITAFATYAGVQYHKQLSLVINKIIPGENGQNAVIYSLNPSVNALKVDKAGNYDVSSISCGLIKTDGTSSVNSNLPEGYTMKYTVDGDNSQVYTLGNNIAVKGIKKKILFQIFKGSTLIDQETIYVINDGIDGEDGKDALSPIFADLDNAVTSVACIPTGEVMFGLPVSTHVNMWYGTEKLNLDSITIAAPSGVTYTTDKIGVTVNGIAAASVDVININITAKATYKGFQYTRELVFTINKIKRGSDGESPVLYDLKPSVSSIKVDKNNNFIPKTVSCTVSRTIAATIDTLSVVPAGFSMYYSKDESKTLNVYSLGSLLSLTGFNSSVTFWLKSGEVVVDMETVPIVKDGIDGEDGNDGLNSVYADLDNAVTAVARSPSGAVLYGLPVSTNVNMWYGTEKLSLDSITVSAPSGVVYTADKVGVRVTSIGTSVADVINVNVTAKATYQDIQYTRNLVFTVNKVKSGNNGENPVLYELKPSVSSVKVDKYNRFTPATISCVVSRTVATNIETLSSLPSGFSIYYSKDGSQTLYNYSYGTSLNIASFGASVSFWLKSGGVTVDAETIPILRDGTDGDAGDDGQNGTFLKQIFVQSDSRPTTPDSDTIPVGWSENNDFGELVILDYEGVFFLEDGARRSPRSPEHSTTHKDKLRFTTSIPNQTITLSVIVSSETSYDCAYIGYIDDEVTTSKYHDKLSGEKSVAISQVALIAGEHYIEIMYSKDGSGSAGQDMVKYKVANSNTIWVSSAQATYDKEAKKWIYGTWSQPSRYLADTPDVEYIFRREETSFIPESSPSQDKYIPLPFTASEDYRGEFNAAYSQVVKAIYRAPGGYYKCIKVRPANSMIEISNEEYFEYIIPFTDDPLGVTDEYPIEYMSMRRKQNGKWGTFSLPAPHARKGETGASGATYRRWKGYTVGQKYRNDDNVTDLSLLEDDGIHYIDVVLLANAAMDTGYDCYIARKFEGQNFWIGTSDTHPLNETFTGNLSPHWQRASNMSSIFTDLIIAKNAILDFMQGNKIQIMNQDGTVNACLGDGYCPIWVGAASPDNASIRFNIDGSGHLAKRNLYWDEMGNMFFRGSSFNQLRPFDNVDDDAIVNLNFSTGFDLDISRLTTYMTPCTILLPSAADYVGAKCTMWFGHFCTRVVHQHPVIAVKDNSSFLNVKKNVTSGSTAVYKISPKQQKKLTFSALPYQDSYGNVSQIGWYLDNPEDVEIIG